MNYILNRLYDSIILEIIGKLFLLVLYILLGLLINKEILLK